MADLYNLIYISESTRDLLPVEIDGILIDARAFNASCDVTGVLFYGPNRFFQLLEGPKESVLQVFERLKLAKSHWNIEILHESPTLERSFSSWYMGFIEAPESAIQELSQSSWIDSFPITRTSHQKPKGLGLVLLYWNKWLAETASTHN
ncbi:BLUF domain-containing protein [Solilutibacter silvestris]|uniref:BLUF domain-containing protein n=1 Tax=Solilutibacter silvestris TaxID=1645665 RepID=UPI003D355141